MKKKLIEIREKETLSHNDFSSYKGTMSKIAIAVKRDEEKFCWFTDELKNIDSVISSSTIELIIKLTKDVDFQSEKY